MLTKQQLIIRLEQPSDYATVENLTREAFWNVHVPGCDEHYLAHILRNSPDFIAELDYIAMIGNKLVGNIMYAKSKIIDGKGKEHPVITFGPVSVLPAQQSKGIGKELIMHTLNLAKELGYLVVVIYGDPDYYVRCGFVAGEMFGIRTSDGLFSPALQVVELVPGALKGIEGCFHEAEVYHIDPLAAEEFDKSFPIKAKFETASQQRFRELLSLSHP
jgi:predicted N-acetyltransferase YhbS